MRSIAAIPIAVLAAACVTRGPAPPAATVPAAPVARRADPAVAPADRLDPAVAGRAALGSRTFAARGCAGCHTIGGGPLVGPDLAGVTVRRDPDWFRSMVTAPDSMLRDDPVARALHARYGARMPETGVAPGEVEALWTYLAVAPEPSPFAEAVPAGPHRGRHRHACPGGRRPGPTG